MVVWVAATVQDSDGLHVLHLLQNPHFHLAPRSTENHWTQQKTIRELNVTTMIHEGIPLSDTWVRGNETGIVVVE